MGGSWGNGFQSVDKRLLGTNWGNGIKSHWTRTRWNPQDKKAMGGAWANGFQSLAKRPMGGSWSNGFQSIEKRPMGGVWPNGFQSRSAWEFRKYGKRDPQVWEFGKFGKRNSEDAYALDYLSGIRNGKRDDTNEFWDMDDDDIMDSMRKRSDLGFLSQRLGKRSEVNPFLHQRMGKRVLQRFGTRFGKRAEPTDQQFEDDLEDLLPNEEKRLSEFYRLIKRAPDRMMKRMLDPWSWYRVMRDKKGNGPLTLWSRAKRPINPSLFNQYVLRN